MSETETTSKRSSRSSSKSDDAGGQSYEDALEQGFFGVADTETDLTVAGVIAAAEEAKKAE